jgi:hypothetical protein
VVVPAAGRTARWTASEDRTDCKRSVSQLGARVDGLLGLI